MMTASFYFLCWIVIAIYSTAIFTGSQMFANSCPLKCNCTQVSISCREVGSFEDVLSGIPRNNRVRKLLITQTEISHIDVNFTIVSELQCLDLSNNKIETIGVGAFADLTQLDTLVLQRNVIRTLINGSFLGLQGLKTLDLSYNLLLGIPDNCFQLLSSLEVLDLTLNDIELLPDDAFAGLEKLKVLNLTRNKISITLKELFKPLRLLETLIINDNSMTFIPPEAFAPLVSLKRLSLIGNQIDSIDPMAFVSMDTNDTNKCLLEDLTLKGTQLREVPKIALSKLTELRSLDLSNTKIDRVSALSFCGLAKLEILKMDSLSNFSQIDQDAFMGVSGLKKLIITNNVRLSQLGNGLFRNLTCLELLDLRGNNISTFHVSLADWKSVDLVDLRFNPIQCDCNVVWILSELIGSGNATSAETGSPVPSKDTATSARSSSSLAREINCMSPAALHGKPLALVPMDDFQCPAIRFKPAELDYGRDQRFKVGLLSVGVSSALLILCGLFIKFRNRICILCRRQYHYKCYRDKSKGSNGWTHESVDMTEMEITQLEDLDSDLDNKVRT